MSLFFCPRSLLRCKFSILDVTFGTVNRPRDQPACLPKSIEGHCSEAPVFRPYQREMTSSAGLFCGEKLLWARGALTLLG
jgi:hypothetical protein